jgi:hypothetical protein
MEITVTYKGDPLWAIYTSKINAALKDTIDNPESKHHIPKADLEDKDNFACFLLALGCFLPALMVNRAYDFELDLIENNEFQKGLIEHYVLKKEL